MPGTCGGEEPTCLPAQETQEMQVQSLAQEKPLKKETAAHSNILAWEIPWTEEPGGYRVRVHNKHGTEHQILENKMLSSTVKFSHHMKIKMIN